MSIMSIRVTGVFSNYLNKVLPDGYSAKVVRLDCNEVKWLLGYDYPYLMEDYGDYDYNSGDYKVIKVTYPEDYYATPRYLSSYDIANMFKGVSTREDLDSAISDNLLI